MIKNIKIHNKNLNKNFINKRLLFLRKYNSKLRKVLFSSVVPNSYKIIKQGSAEDAAFILKNAESVIKSGANGIAVISEISRFKNPYKISKSLSEIINTN